MKGRFMERGRILALGLVFLAAAVARSADAGPLPVTIPAAYVPAIANGLDPADPVWANPAAPELSVALDIKITDKQGMMSMMAMQWRWVRVKAAHDGTNIYFRLRFADATADTSVADAPVFADAFALQIPFFTYSAVAMGDQFSPVNIIFWRADLPNPQNIVAGGPGTVQKSPDSGGPPPDTPPLVTHSQSRAAGTWTVILKRPMNGAAASPRGNMVSFVRGRQYKVIFANWNGVLKERNGVKMISGNWQNLAIK